MKRAKTIAIIAGFGVQSEGETYVVPLDCVLECLELPDGAALVDHHSPHVPAAVRHDAVRRPADVHPVPAVHLAGAGAVSDDN